MKIFQYCPSCKSSDISYDGIKQFKCSSCSFTYFHNIAAAAAAILEYDKKILLIRRAKEPGKDKLDLPGGFIDPKESAEEGLKREITEELGITINEMKYLGSSPNIYEYKGITYNTCDLFFYSKIQTLPTDFNKSEISAIELKEPSGIHQKDVAFTSTIKGIRLFINTKN